MVSKNTEKSDNSASADSTDFSEKLNDILRKYRMVLVVFAVATGLAVTLAIGWTVMNGIALEASAVSMEKMNKSFEAWYSAEDAKKTELETLLRADIDAAIKAHGSRYAGLKALLLKARMHFEKKEYAEAQKAYLEVFEKGRKFDLGVVGLRNAASCALASGDTAKGIELYARLVGEFPASDGYPHDSYLLGLLYEDAKDYAKARECYNQLVATKPDDDWTKLARSRIIFLTSNGL
ncbi:MAG: tetratricopeptide repeat protein [Spirochaetes bacterium]|nr:tetratricopeptide repeat protein [Spirochaetota bacterium]